MSLSFAWLLLVLSAPTRPLNVTASAPAVEGPGTSTFTPVVKSGLGVGPSGFGLFAEVGVQSWGLQTLADDRWLLQWDALLAFRSAVLANTWPLTGFVGVATHDFVELGTRFLPTQPWSPYLGARLGGDASVMARPGNALNSINTLNANEGYGSIAVAGAARLAAGASRLSGDNAVLLTAFLQEALVAPRVMSPGVSFTEVGLAGRLDLHRTLTIALEGLVGLAPTRTNDALHLTDQQLRLQISGSVQKTFANGVWLAFAASYTRDSDRTVYLNSHTVYETVNAGTTSGAFTVGVPLWRHQ